MSHFGVPMAGAVLNALNTRLDAEAIAFMLDHAEAKVLFIDREYSKVIARALELMKGARPLVIDVDDPSYTGGSFLGEIEYEAFLAEGDPSFVPAPLEDEWDAISLNYTSGTTGNPKGVVYHHRGAYLNAVNNIVSWGMPPHSVYLWTLPMFHCNGWCFPWTMAANAGVNVCLRRVEAKAIFALIREHRVTHYCGAPIVHSMLINADPADQALLDHRVDAADRRRRAAGRDHRGHGKARRLHHPCLWPDRDLWPGFGVRQADGMGVRAAGETGRTERPPGRALAAAGRDRRVRHAALRARSPRRRRPWARSFSAAIS